MNKSIKVLCLIIVFITVFSCKNSNPEEKHQNDSDQAKNENPLHDNEEKEPCSSVYYSEKFQAVFISEGACGTLNDIHWVYVFSNGICSDTKKVVDMSKYIVLDEKEKCSDNDGIVFTYERKQNIKEDDPDPNEKNWYVYKRKSDGICTDPHYGKIISGANKYDMVCGPLTKTEASDCWSEKCDD